MLIHLKVKICTLAAESKIIRIQQRNLLKRVKPLGEHPIHSIPTSSRISLDEHDMEKIRAFRIKKKLHKAKCAIIKMGIKPKEAWPSLQEHRRIEVRSEARYALIAYAFLRGKEYFAIERKCHNVDKNLWREVEKNVKRFTTEEDTRIVLQRFEEWSQRGRENQARFADQQKAAKGGGIQTRLSA